MCVGVRVLVKWSLDIEGEGVVYLILLLLLAVDVGWLVVRDPNTKKAKRNVTIRYCGMIRGWKLIIIILAIVFLFGQRGFQSVSILSFIF